MEDLEMFIAVLYALAVGDNGRCSVRSMLKDDPDGEFIKVPWLRNRGITESWLTGWSQNIHFQPEGWETSEEAKKMSRSLNNTKIVRR